jgi:ADP-ribose pyrophosphatase
LLEGRESLSQREKKMGSWPLLGREVVYKTPIFSLWKEQVTSPRTGEDLSLYVLDSLDWVNVIPLTSAGEVVLIRQYRQGTRALTLEIPGGMIERGESPAEGAARELLEETGRKGSSLSLLGVVEPNPAILNNRCYTYLAHDVEEVAEQELDRGEEIEVLPTPLSEVPGLIASGAIQHSLVVVAFYWLLIAREGGFEPQKGPTFTANLVRDKT